MKTQLGPVAALDDTFDHLVASEEEESELPYIQPMPMAYAFELIVAGGQTLPDVSDSSNQDTDVQYSQQEPGVASRFRDLSWCKCGC